MSLLCFIVVFLLGCNLYLSLGWTYITPIAFGLYFKGPSSSFGLVTLYSILGHQNFPLNRSHTQMQLFRDTIDECGFLDMGYKGHSFTWKKFFSDGQTIGERLDRCLANNEWMIHFGGSTVHHLTCSTSGHSPLWILPKNLVVVTSNKPFRFEEMWLAEKRCSNTVKAKWGKCRNNNNNNIPLGFVKKIEDCGKALTKWSRNSFGSIWRELKHKQKLLAQAKLEALTTGVNFKARMLKTKANDLLDKETRMWFQQSRSLWAVHGDKNSK